MKIGILTFHWATNYGAVLQCYALQTYLESLGHKVNVINYKPSFFDESVYKFLRYRKFLHLSSYFKTIKMEKMLVDFRNKYLKQTDRVLTINSIEKIASVFDIIISGSDQVLNPSFLMGGEGAHKITPTYFLDFPFDGKRIGYALSFGCVKYPENSLKEARKHIGTFDILSVRESSGIEIVRSMGRDDVVVVPDPTLLMPAEFYHSLADECTYTKLSYTYCFFIRHITERKRAIKHILKDRPALWNNDDRRYSLQEWLSKIKHSEFIITDSFHCMVMCLKLHTPFVVITEQEGNVGMNDRLYTLLGEIGMKKCVVHKNNLDAIYPQMNETYNWKDVDFAMKKLQNYGYEFITNNI